MGVEQSEMYKIVKCDGIRNNVAFLLSCVEPFASYRMVYDKNDKFLGLIKLYYHNPEAFVVATNVG